jgi:RNA polymerase sigma-70 factor, ECF subfamily
VDGHSGRIGVVRQLDVAGSVGMTAAAGRDDLADAMVRAGRGDQDAFAEVYDATSSRVFGLIVRVIRDRDLAAEVSQEVYLDAWRGAGGFDPQRGSVPGWLLTLAHRKAVDRVRAVTRAQGRDQRYADQEALVAPPSSDQVVDEDEQRRVRSALTTLPEAQREALTLAYYDGCTQLEVSNRLGIPLGTVKTRIRDGMQRLRRQLVEEDA